MLRIGSAYLNLKSFDEAFKLFSEILKFEKLIYKEDHVDITSTLTLYTIKLKF